MAVVADSDLSPNCWQAPKCERLFLMRSSVKKRLLCAIRAFGAAMAAGLAGTRWSVEAETPGTAPRVANAIVHCCTGEGPDEHRMGLVSKTAIALGFNVNVEYRVASRNYFEPCPAGMQTHSLHRLPKR